MLVITRRNGESLTIGDAKVTLLQRGNKIRLAIDAPKSVKVLRSELAPREAGKH